MMRSGTRGVLAGMLATMLLLLASPDASAVTPTNSSPISPARLKAEAIHFQAVGEVERRDLAVSSMGSEWSRTLWTDFVSSWRTINQGIKINPKVPDGIPKKGHLFVVLGSALTSAGKMPAKLTRRMEVALKALTKYPNSAVLVTGGKPRKGKTEAGAMRAWLLAKGIPASRILVEQKSTSTIGNAANSMAILAKKPAFTSYSLITASSHMRRSMVLFNAAVLQVQEKSGKRWNFKQVANVAHMDMATAGQGPWSASSIEYAASNVASLLGVSSQYRTAKATPPTKLILNEISVTTPTTFAVGSKLDLAKVEVTARYNQGAYTRSGLRPANVTGFDSSAVGAGNATVSYTEGGSTSEATFSYTITKAVPKITAKLSTNKVKASRTKVVLRAKLAIPNGLDQAGTMTFRLDGKKVKTLTLTPGKAAEIRLTYPKMKKTGKRTLSVEYSGSDLLNSAKAILSIRVTR